MREILTSPQSVIEALGGFSSVSDLTGAKYNAVFMWGENERIPAKYSAVINAALEKRGKSADLSVFGIIKPEEAA